MKYNAVLPYFPKADIREIVKSYKDILSGDGVLTMGKYVGIFESEFARYIGTKYAIATSSCTSALEIALKVIGIKKEDEVIVPVQTFIATGSSVITNGGTIVFCEVDDNFLLDFEDLKRKITRRTKAVIIVHFTGLIHPNIFEIRRYLRERNIYLVEDAAHAHGAKIDDTYAGNIGDFGCFSFYSTKIITTGEGGMVTTNDKAFYYSCDSLRNRGIDIKANAEIYSHIGSNRRITEFQGILGIHQLKRSEEFIGHRNRIAAIYRKILSPLEERGLIAFQRYPSNIRHAYWRFLVFLRASRKTREGIKKSAARIGIKIDWPYEPLLHLQPVFRKIYGIRKGYLKKSEKLATTHFCIPTHLKIRENDAVFIADKIKRIIQ